MRLWVGHLRGSEVLAEFCKVGYSATALSPCAQFPLLGDLLRCGTYAESSFERIIGNA